MISTHCELLLLRFLMYVNDYGTQWRIVRATLTMPAITDGWSWIRAATVCGCAALYCTVICFVHFSSGPCYLPNFRLVSNSTAANRRVPYYSEKNGPVRVNTWSKSRGEFLPGKNHKYFNKCKLKIDSESFFLFNILLKMVILILKCCTILWLIICIKYLDKNQYMFF